MKKSIVTLALIISTCGLYAQNATYKSGSVLWKVSGKDLKNPSYLLGTFHLKSGEYLDTIPGASEAFKSCEQVVGEIDMSNMLGMQMQMQQAMMMSSDTTYKMLYSDEEYSFVSEKVASLAGMGLDQFGMLKPAAIQLTVVMYAYMKHFPQINPVNTLDARIQSEAVNQQKKVLALETVEDQIYVLFGIMSLKRQAEVLLCYLNNMDKIMAFVPDFIDAYNQGNINRLFENDETSESCPSTPEETAALNKDRNLKWMKKLPDIMKEGSSFIAVGALHLAGEDGLLNLLEKSGYKVEPIGINQ